ncbi:acyl-coenzyme A diphosphatase NUDT19-like [Onthophagus taurus]|uniref:acyl-coenzyme A diphosphatase NUDT19-like n=1 Tax=Onthophagus taurus TaxID=166361 RepID=UPI000C20394C|nr:nucleoside diphosphate-linked moiety X motif 19-like [Onthophagus taurus]
MRPSLKPWRDSASIILVAKTAFAPAKKQSDFNYKLLSIKRSSRSGFMPGTYVFPGGAICKADVSRDWLKLYEDFGFKYDSFDKLNPKDNRPKLFKDTNDVDLPKFLSLRIGAIRETFEECGILICRSYKINYKERIARWGSFIDLPEIKKWQLKVHDDPEKFIEMCRKFEIYPDVWSLKEWANWVTPPSLPIRFDVAFFLTAFQQTPAAYAEEMEVSHLEWGTPADYLTRNRNEEILLPPPQFYEMCRLKNFLDIDNLLKFSGERAVHGVERYFPSRVDTKDGLYSILPGDDLYPESIDETNDQVPFVDKLPASHVQNRILHRSPYNNAVFTLNFKPKCNHILPSNYPVNKL